MNKNLSVGAEIWPEDISDTWEQGRASLFVDMVHLANDYGIDVWDFLEQVYKQNGLEKVLEFGTQKVGFVNLRKDKYEQMP